ncbi:hypothetical protein ACLB2K_001311 [Fragaria x ananassa]
MDIFASLFQPVVTSTMNEELTRVFTEEEVHRALKQMHPYKAPGPDGFSPIFYQRFWHLVGKDITKAVWCFMNSKDLMREVNETHVTLIPKVKDLEYITQLRPISLCNVIYKLGSKVLSNRLKPLLDLIIAPNQSAFVPGRQIADNSLLAFEVSHHLKRLYNSAHGFEALKLDMSKAYDRVEWVFLERVMQNMGFHDLWIKWIMDCVSTVSYSFILNGEPRGRLIPSRGLRQGDSISPYLFLLCAEGLSRMLTYAESRGFIHGVVVASGAPSINHLFFADDSFVFMRAEEEECTRLKNILQAYEEASGQQVHFQKSAVSFSKNVDLDLQNRLAALFEVERVNKHKKYLGLPTEVSYSKTEAFAYIMDKTKEKMKGWKDRILSAAGKEIMIKTVVQSIPPYVMSIFELPKHICNELHRCMAGFWWGDSEKGKKIHWLAWEWLCASKEEGGLGFRNMELFNQALLAKQVWRLMQQPDSLASRVLRAKYYPDGLILSARANSGASYAWRSLVKGIELLSKGIRYQIGSGRDVSVWQDPWIPRPYTFRPYSGMMEGLEELKVADLIDPDNREWMRDWLEELFFADEVELIMRIPLSLRNREDKLVWHFDRHGLYSVRSGYHVARRLRLEQIGGTSSVLNSNSSSLWQKIWKVKVLPKVKHFIWRLIKNIVPTKEVLSKRVPLPDLLCPFCYDDTESSLHLFKNCNVVACIWLFSPLGMRARHSGMETIEVWIQDMLENLPAPQVEVFFMLLWSIWVERNNVVWNGSRMDPRETVRWAMDLLDEYKRVHPVAKKGKGSRHEVRWIFPPRGRLKLNLDGAYREDGAGGAGMLVRDEKGFVKGAWSMHLTHLNSPLQAEAMACREGLRRAVEQGWVDIDVESDCEVLVAALNCENGYELEVSRIIDDCRDYLALLNNCVVRHIYREANSGAHRLAHFASYNNVVELSVGLVPIFLQDVLYEDSCNASSALRGKGITSPSVGLNSININNGRGAEPPRLEAECNINRAAKTDDAFRKSSQFSD